MGRIEELLGRSAPCARNRSRDPLALLRLGRRGGARRARSARLVSAGLAGQRAARQPGRLRLPLRHRPRGVGIVEQLARFRGNRMLPSFSSAAAWRRARAARARRRRQARGSRRPVPSSRVARLRPSRVATRQRELTQPQALAAYADGADALSWWSSHESLWTNVTVFDRARRPCASRTCACSGSAMRPSPRRPSSSAWRPDVVRGGPLVAQEARRLERILARGRSAAAAELGVRRPPLAAESGRDDRHPHLAGQPLVDRSRRR